MALLPMQSITYTRFLECTRANIQNLHLAAIAIHDQSLFGHRQELGNTYRNLAVDAKFEPDADANNHDNRMDAEEGVCYMR
jgi:hypothetical protein